MFTGLVEETARIVSVEPIGGGARLTLEASVVLEGTHAGDSIAVNGCCLTITAMAGNRVSTKLAEVQIEIPHFVRNDMAHVFPFWQDVDFQALLPAVPRRHVPLPWR